MSDAGATQRRRWRGRLAALAVLVAVGVALRLTVLAPAPIEVRVTVLERGRVESTLTNSKAGTVKAVKLCRGKEVITMGKTEAKEAISDIVLKNIMQEKIKSIDVKSCRVLIEILTILKAMKWRSLNSGA